LSKDLECGENVMIRVLIWERYIFDPIVLFASERKGEVSEGRNDEFPGDMFLNREDMSSFSIIDSSSSRF
jgi:hypothetical protein